jgi:hypothetical protein
MRGYRTLAVSLLTILIGGLQTATGELSPEWSGYIIQTVGVLTLVLRMLTTTPLGQKPEDSA